MNGDVVFEKLFSGFSLITHTCENAYSSVHLVDFTIKHASINYEQNYDLFTRRSFATFESTK